MGTAIQNKKPNKSPYFQQRFKSIPPKYWGKIGVKDWNHNDLEANMWGKFGTKKLRYQLDNPTKHANLLFDYNETYKKKGSKWGVPHHTIRINPKNRLTKNGTLPKMMSAKGSPNSVFNSHFDTFPQDNSKKHKVVGTEGEIKAIISSFFLGVDTEGHKGHSTAAEAIRSKTDINKYGKGIVIDATFQQRTIDYLLANDTETYIFILDSDALDNHGKYPRSRQFFATVKKLLMAKNNFNKTYSKSLNLDIAVCSPIGSTNNVKYGIDDLVEEFAADIETIKSELFDSPYELNKYFRVWRNITTKPIDYLKQEKSEQKKDFILQTSIEIIENAFQRSVNFNDTFKPCHYEATRTINKYIGENPFKIEYEKTLILSPPNSGKSWEMWQPNKTIDQIQSATKQDNITIIIASPLTALARQQKVDADRYKPENDLILVCEGSANAEFVRTCAAGYITTYASIDKLCKRLKQDGRQFFLILDEKTEQTRATYQNNYMLNHWINEAYGVCGMTGTPLMPTIESKTTDIIGYKRKEQPQRTINVKIATSKKAALTHLFENRQTQGQILNFVPSRADAEITAQKFGNCMVATAYHAKQTKTEKRENVLFKSIMDNAALPANSCLSVTNKVMEFGVNVNNLTVINYVASSVFDYINFYQAINRARQFDNIEINVYLVECLNTRYNFSDLPSKFINQIIIERQTEVKKLNSLYAELKRNYDGTQLETMRNAILEGFKESDIKRFSIANNQNQETHIRFNSQTKKFFVWEDSIINMVLGMVNESHNTYNIIKIIKNMFKDVTVQLIGNNETIYTETKKEYNKAAKEQESEIVELLNTDIEQVMSHVIKESSDNQTQKTLQQKNYRYDKQAEILPQRFEIIQDVVKRYLHCDFLQYGKMDNVGMVELIADATKWNKTRKTLSKLNNIAFFTICKNKGIDYKKFAIVSPNILRNYNQYLEDKNTLFEITQAIESGYLKASDLAQNLGLDSERKAINTARLFFDLKSVTIVSNGRRKRLWKVIKFKGILNEVLAYIETSIDKNIEIIESKTSHLKTEFVNYPIEWDMAL